MICVDDNNTICNLLWAFSVLGGDRSLLCIVESAKNETQLARVDWRESLFFDIFSE